MRQKLIKGHAGQHLACDINSGHSIDQDFARRTRFQADRAFGLDSKILVDMGELDQLRKQDEGENEQHKAECVSGPPPARFRQPPPA